MGDDTVLRRIAVSRTSQGKSDTGANGPRVIVDQNARSKGDVTLAVTVLFNRESRLSVVVARLRIEAVAS